MRWPAASSVAASSNFRSASSLAAKIELGTRHEIVVAAILFAYPVLLLIWRGASNILFAFLALYSLGLLYGTRRQAKVRLWDRDTLLFAVAMGLPTAAIALSQLSHVAFNIKPYDSALTMLLCVPKVPYYFRQ